ncbi:MAG TPA: nicotinamide riboside transporter PnuC [Flammeovirgaceae bacterium]|nr:nicotinamide riboside transporter PnuC [Flammeovirgaceae bacterium]
MWQQIIDYALGIDVLEFAGLIFGLLAVWFLIRQNILTWPAGIIYILISFVIFWRVRLYGDFILHVFFLVLNIYGWYYWLHGRKNDKEELPVTTFSLPVNLLIALVTALGVWGFGYLLQRLPDYFSGLSTAALPYWDATTTILSVTAMWLTTRKKLENWYYWLVVDILATGIYVYKEIYFYAFLYGVYIIMAFSGLLAWKKSMHTSPR